MDFNPLLLRWGGYSMRVRDILPLASPGVRNTADNRAEHESCDEGEQHEVDEAFQSIVTQTCHALDVVLQQANI